MVDVIQDFFSSGTMPRGLNHTFIALIPKGEGSSRLSQFRPISLCNVVYKAISKIMTNRKGCFQRLFPLIRVLLFRAGSSTIKQSLHKSWFMF